MYLIFFEISTNFVENGDYTCTEHITKILMPEMYHMYYLS